MKRRTAVLFVALALLASVVDAPRFVREAAATITCTITNTFQNQTGSIPLSQLDANFTNLNACYSGLVAALTDLPLTRAYTGTQRWAKGANITSASALTLGSDGNYFVVTGTTTITSISSLEAGTAILLQFNGALTLTHNATSLILMGATNATTASGDLYWFVSEGGGNWREVGRRVVTNADASHVWQGNGVWGTASSGAFTLVGSTNTEVTTTSTAEVDGVTLGSISIATTSPVEIRFQLRKSAGAANASNFGLKINATKVISGATWSSAANEIQSAVVTCYIGPRDASYLRAGICSVAAAGASLSAAGFINVMAAADIPTATITSITAEMSSGNAAVTTGSNYLKVYTLSP